MLNFLFFLIKIVIKKIFILFKFNKILIRNNFFCFYKFNLNKPIDQNVSVIIPTYNGADTLESLLDSLARQKKVLIKEIIIIDSGSSDETLAIAKKNSLVKIIKINHKLFNHASARNLAAEKAIGDFLLFTVQDAHLSDDLAIYKLISVISHHPECAAVSARQQISKFADAYADYENSELYEGVSLLADYRLTKGIKNIPNQILEYRDLTFLDNVLAIYDKKVFKKLNGFPVVKYGEDIAYAHLALQNKYQVGLINKALVTHSHTRPLAYVLKRNFTGYYPEKFQFSVPKIINESITDHLVIVGWLLAELSTTQPKINFWMIKNLCNLNKKIIVDLNIKEIFKNHQIDFFENCYSVQSKINQSLFKKYFFNLIKSYIRALFNYKTNFLDADKEKKYFLKKILVAELGKNLAIVLSKKNRFNRSQYNIKHIKSQLESNV